jgi:hypothetical protein
MAGRTTWAGRPDRAERAAMMMHHDVNEDIAGSMIMALLDMLHRDLSGDQGGPNWAAWANGNSPYELAIDAICEVRDDSKASKIAADLAMVGGCHVRVMNELEYRSEQMGEPEGSAL